MQQAEQTLLSLRPGGGRGRFGYRFESSSSSSSPNFGFGSSSSVFPHLRPHGGVPSAFFIKVYGSRVFVSLFGGVLCSFFFFLNVCNELLCLLVCILILIGY